MKLSELIPPVAGSDWGPVGAAEITGLTQDSRLAGRGIAFFAIEGSQRDGHDFASAAADAAALVVRAGHPKAVALAADPMFSGRLVPVKDTREALGVAASRYFGEPSTKVAVCGVTGTNGKTTCTYLLEALFEERGNSTAVIGTVENRLLTFRMPSAHTTPDAVTLQGMLAEFARRGATAAALEVSSHALDQKRTAGMRFEAALFTNLTQDHLDYHATMQAYFEAKCRLFLEYPVRSRVIHADDPYGARLAGLCSARGLDVVTFGRSGCTVNYGDLTTTAAGIDGELSVNHRGAAGRIGVRSPLLGAFNAQNLCGVAAVGVALGMPLPRIGTALGRARRVPGRMETVPNNRGVTVVVDYAHTPDAMEKALRTLRALCAGRLVCVFGCGGDRDAAKRPVMGAVAEQLADEVFATSDNPRTEDPGAILDAILGGMQRPGAVRREPDRRRAIAAAIASLHAGDVCLIAGKGHEDYQIVRTEKLPFDDREVALENLR